jgi:Mn-dependent DtxR family transcriptional regulator
MTWHPEPLPDLDAAVLVRIGGWWPVEIKHLAWELRITRWDVKKALARLGRVGYRFFDTPNGVKLTPASYGRAILAWRAGVLDVALE